MAWDETGRSGDLGLDRAWLAVECKGVLVDCGYRLDLGVECRRISTFRLQEWPSGDSRQNTQESPDLPLQIPIRDAD
jgi:hypothetical protein